MFRISTLLLSGLFLLGLMGCGPGNSGDDLDAGVDAGEVVRADGTEEAWDRRCTQTEDCEEPVGLCSKQPGTPEGYCSTRCLTTADCPYGGWTCNAIGGCDDPVSAWCGPPEEQGEFLGIITACD